MSRNLVRAWSNIYFNSIEEIPYSHCPIKVLKFNIYTESIAETAYNTDSIAGWLFFGRHMNAENQTVSML